MASEPRPQGGGRRRGLGWNEHEPLKTRQLFPTRRGVRLYEGLLVHLPSLDNNNKLLGIVAEIQNFLRITKINLWSNLATRGRRVHLHTLVDR